MSGNTVVMRVSRNFQFLNTLTNAVGGPINQVMGYQGASVLTTLTKQ